MYIQFAARSNLHSEATVPYMAFFKKLKEMGLDDFLDTDAQDEVKSEKYIIMS